MSSKPLLPQAFWFRVAASCPRIAEIPLGGSKGPLLDLPASCDLPDLAPVDSRSSWTTIRAGWNPSGLGVSVIAEGDSSLSFSSDPAENLAYVHLWIDTRDTRDVSRATRFCHRFTTRLTFGRDRKSVKAETDQRVIARALADAPMARAGEIQSRATATAKGGWVCELFFSSSALHGFDPDTNRRLGFTYHITDSARPEQFLTVGRDFPIAAAALP